MATEFAQLTESLKQKMHAKIQRNKRYERRETQYSQKKFLKKILKILLNLAHEEFRGTENFPLYQKQ